MKMEQVLSNNHEFLRAIKNDDFAQAVYAGLCNVKWYHENDKNDIFSFTWRYAGDLVSLWRNKKEDYMDFYCSGFTGGIKEGTVIEDVKKIMEKMGFHPILNDDTSS